ncbi:fructosamine kinase family protein [Leisingera sp. NJS204]|uniref:fructosamine kinase family protein n=1 Tax=Leisingera sp. NJS204 TaxID=2508307 RepID=UPI0020C7BEDF|nr:fructosamine kinase family protein [Leisingera sp. NJS204]
MDLAMLHLFGARPEAFHESYGAPEPGHEVRRAIYQLWPALVHLRLFGASYRSMVETRLDALGV